VIEARTWRSAKALGYEIFADAKYEASASYETYSMGSYAVTIPLGNMSSAQEIVWQLWKDGFLDKQTRLVVVEATFYNAFNHLHTNTRFGFEFRASGGINPQARVLSFHLFQYDWSSVKSNILFLLEMVLYSLVLMFISIMFFQIITFGVWGWLKKISVITDDSEKTALVSSTESNQSVFELLDQTNLVLLLVLFIYKIIGLCNSWVQEYDLPAAMVNYENHTPVAVFVATQVNVWGINALIAVLKVFKYLQISTTLNSLWRTIVFAFNDILNFMVFFIVVMFMFSITGIVLFGSVHRDWCGVNIALSTLFRIILGQIDFQGIAEINYWASFVYFFMFIILVFLILLNMFLAIINNAYSHIMAENMKTTVKTWEITNSVNNAWSSWDINEVTTQIGVLWDSLLVCDFAGTKESNLKEIAEDYLQDGTLDKEMAEDGGTADEEALDEELEERRELEAAAAARAAAASAGSGPNYDLEWFKVATMEELNADATQNHVISDRDKKFELPLAPEDPSLREGSREEIERRREKIAHQEKVKELTEQFDVLQEQCVLYMDIDTQLIPPWLAAQFRELELNARKAGCEDVMNKAISQANLIEMTENRSATTSRLFALFNPNEAMPHNAPQVFRPDDGD